MFKEVKEFDYITVSEAKELMEKIAEVRQKKGELLYETRRALKHLRTFAKLPSDKAREVVEELMKLPFVSKETAVKIVDMMPQNPDEVRLIYAKEKVTLKAEDIESILEILNRYR
ncbi:MAG: RNA polymerase Rpb4 [Archaeoglobales archaeon]|nr:MAG: RNA polymerase Rpb4 [Archaeoglobales archaeon]